MICVIYSIHTLWLFAMIACVVVLVSSVTFCRLCIVTNTFDSGHDFLFVGLTNVVGLLYISNSVRTFFNTICRVIRFCTDREAGGRFLTL